MGDGHDFPVVAIGQQAPGGDLELGGQAIWLDDQAMVTSRLEWIFKPIEEESVRMVDGVGLSMHEPFGADDLGVKCLTNRLMAEADSQ